MKKNTKKLLFFILMTCVIIQYVSATDTQVKASDFNGKKIAIQSGTTFVTLVDDIFEDADVLYYEFLPDCIAAVKQGKADAVLGDEPAVRYCISQVEGVSYILHGETADYMASIAPKTEEGEKYISQFNEYYRKIVENGERDKLLSKWLDGSPVEQTIEDYSKFPATNGTLIIATDPSFPPLQFVRNDMIVGYEIELWVNFCKEYGYKPQIESVSFGGIIAGVISGKYNIGASGFSITDERKQKVLFSDVIVKSGTAIAFASGKSKVDFTTGFNSTFLQDNRWKSFLSGIFVTTRITVFSILLGIVLGFGLYLLVRGGNKYVIVISEVFKRLIVGMPVVVWLMVLYYIFFGKSGISGEAVAVIGFSILFAFSISSMLAMGERSVDSGQAIAADAMGYSKRKTFFRIILPQAIQMMLPSFQDESISHLKATAIVGYIAVVDVTKVGDLIRGMTYDAFFPLIAVALAYFILSGILRLIIFAVRKKTDPHLRSNEAVLKGAVLK